MEQDGYLITSIPYDSHLEIKVDGRGGRGQEKVNTAFLGCRDGKAGALGDDHLPRPGTFHGKMDQPAGGLFVWSDVFSDGEMKKKQRKRQMKKLQNMPLV